ncbi:SDR family oxidoreductase [Labedaea rhizosphaerae]|uniref:NADP-dependent 3-hydroxy acid dehydrogenase YdfG n=1 Tax=Labedaea rhizosphaerae TaxID=598644 RepID=A0A4R6RXN1_LABRH|nr:SDR family oxidoreductase [Labedaea rhizosphaerae]TDP91852.1 NADP-dependent 3-hydroxy acid dehydrogenase YdfG [Labedaea rhizosphaerae]
MTTKLADRVAVVTGAASGIGAGTARRLAVAGAKVALLARRAERLDALAAELGNQALAVPVDVTDTEAVDEAAARIAATLGPVDLVVNNAGVMLPSPVEQVRFDTWQRMIDTNVLGVLRVVRAFVPSLIDTATAGGPADLVNISSLGAHVAFPGYSVYSASKAAVTMLSESVRTELGPKGVRITNIEPGLTETELREHVDDPDGRALVDGMFAQIPALGADDVAEFIEFAVSRPAHVNFAQVHLLPTRQA